MSLVAAPLVKTVGKDRAWQPFYVLGMWEMKTVSSRLKF